MKPFSKMLTSNVVPFSFMFLQRRYVLKCNLISSIFRSRTKVLFCFHKGACLAMYASVLRLKYHK